MIVRYALTRDAAGEVVFRDDELQEIVGFSFAERETDLERFVCDCEFRFITLSELRAAKDALQAAGFEVAPV